VALRAPGAALLAAALLLADRGLARGQEGEATELSPEDQALLDMAMKGEVIEVWAERPN